MKAPLVKKEYVLPFILIASLFFLWGFARAILDVLNKHFQEALDLSKTESSLIQVMVYSAYFLMAIPAGLYITRHGYRRGVVFGLALFGIGALLFIPSEWIMSFPAFLFSLFVLGCGLVFLETAANPYAATLGDPSTAASRLNLAQSLNGLGCVLAPIIGAAFLFSDSGDGSVAIPYGVMGVVVLCVAIMFTRVNLPEITQDDTSATVNESAGISALWRKKRFVLGITALFFYEIAEISINSFFINYTTDDGWLSPMEAAKILSFCGLGLFLIGRVIGSLVMSRVRAELVLTVCAVFTVLGAAFVALDLGFISKGALFCCYAFESIMFPTIFALSLRGLGSYTKRASSFMMMTPIGGAVGTFMMGLMADLTSMSTAFIVPCVGYSVVLIYALYVLREK